MSQSRTRKAPPAGDSGRPRPLAKASGVVTKETNEPPTHNSQHHRSTTRIPKNIRYDLENALVGLCDVWFEDIKPYLLRNNIRLHVQGAGAEEAAAGGDRGRLPSAVPGCSHLDPGAATDSRRRRDASCAGCCPAPQVTSRARSHKQRQPPFKLLSPVVSAATTPIAESQRNIEEPMVPPWQANRPQQSCSRPKHPSVASSYAKTSATSGLGHKYNYNQAASPNAQKQSHDRSSPRKSLEVNLPTLVESPKKKEQSTQTVALRCKRRRQQKCQRALSPKKDVNTRQKSPARRQKSVSLVRRQMSSAPVEMQQPPRRQRKPRKLSSSRRKRYRNPLAASPVRRRKTQVAPKIPAPGFPVPYNEYTRDLPLCQDDLYFILEATCACDTHLMYDSPRREENPETLNLILSPEKKERVKVMPHWR